MKKFRKIVAIEPVNMLPFGEEKFRTHCEELILFNDIPSSSDEVIRRIGDADCLLVVTPPLLRKKFCLPAQI